MTNTINIMEIIFCTTMREGILEYRVVGSIQITMLLFCIIPIICQGRIVIEINCNPKKIIARSCISLLIIIIITDIRSRSGRRYNKEDCRIHSPLNSGKIKVLSMLFASKQTWSTMWTVSENEISKAVTKVPSRIKMKSHNKNYSKTFLLKAVMVRLVLSKGQLPVRTRKFSLVKLICET